MDNFREFPISALNYLVSKVKALLAGKQDKLTFDSTPTAGSSNPVTSDGIKKAIDAIPTGGGESVTETFHVAFEMGASGFKLDDNVTYDDITLAFSEGKQVIGLTFVPEAAGFGSSGFFSLPLTHITIDGGLIFSAAVQATHFTAMVLPNGNVMHSVGDMESRQYKVTSISAYSTDLQYPSAKAVYNAIQNAATGFANGESDMYT